MLNINIHMNIYIYIYMVCIFSSTLIMCGHVLLNIDHYILLKSKTAMPTEVLWQLQTPDTRLQRVTPLTSAVCPPHGRRRRRHLEGGNGRVGSTRSGCSYGFGPDVAPGCPFGLTYHNQVKTSVGQIPSDKSQRRRSPGQLVQG